MKKTLQNILKFLSAASLLIMLLLVVWQVFTRYILNNPSTWSEELVGFLFAWSTLFGASLIVSERGHMNIPVLMDTKEPATQKKAAIFSEIMILLFSLSVLTYGGIRITNLALNQMTSSLGVPIGWFYIPLPITGIINTIFCILNIKSISRGEVEFFKAKNASEASNKQANNASEVAKFDEPNDLAELIEEDVTLEELSEETVPVEDRLASENKTEASVKTETSGEVIKQTFESDLGNKGDK